MVIVAAELLKVIVVTICTFQMKSANIVAVVTIFNNYKICSS